MKVGSLHHDVTKDILPTDLTLMETIVSYFTCHLAACFSSCSWGFYFNETTLIPDILQCFIREMLPEIKFPSSDIKTFLVILISDSITRHRHFYLVTTQRQQQSCKQKPGWCNLIDFPWRTPISLKVSHCLFTRRRVQDRSQLVEDEFKFTEVSWLKSLVLINFLKKPWTLICNLELTPWPILCSL